MVSAGVVSAAAVSAVSAATGSVLSTGAATASGASSVPGAGSMTGGVDVVPETETIGGEFSVTLYLPSGPRSAAPEIGTPPRVTLPGAAEASPVGPRSAASPL